MMRAEGNSRRGDFDETHDYFARVRAGDRNDLGGKSERSAGEAPAASGNRGTGAWACGRIFSRRAEETGHSDCGDCGTGPRAVCDVREEVWARRKALSRR